MLTPQPPTPDLGLCPERNALTASGWHGSDGAARILVGYERTASAPPPVVGGADAVLPAAAPDVRQAHGLTHVRSVVRGVELVRADPRRAAATLEALRSDPRVRYARPDGRLRTLAPPVDDPLYPQQFHLTDFGVPEAWEHYATAVSPAAVTVAVIDVGFNVDHPDLADVFVGGYDIGNDDADVSLHPDVRDDHGNHVAGIVAAATDNAVGGAGVAHENVRVVPVKVAREYTDPESGARRTTLEESLLARAIVWASAEQALPDAPRNPHPADVINVSLGQDKCAEQAEALNDAVATATENGAIVVAASGNAASTASPDAGDGVYSPANAPDALAVGSVGRDRTRDSFSKYTEGDPDAVDFMAPGGQGLCGLSTGVGVLSTDDSTDPDDGYRCQAGTSMASPFVAASLALLQSFDPGAGDATIVERLRRETWNDAGAMPDDEYGAGIVCLDAALGAATRCGE